jgi:type I restriction enzyme S subunit
MTWPTKKLKELADVRMGETLIKKDLTGDGTPIFSAGTDINPWGFTKKNKLTFGKNSIVLSARGNIGEPRLPLLEKFTATQTTIVVTNKSESILDTVFLWRFLQTFNFNTLKNQATIPMMTVSDINKIEIPLPPLKIQKQIVARIEELFEKIDKAKELRQIAREEATQIFPSALQKIFKEAEKKWGLETLENICWEITDGTHYTPKYKSKGVPFLSVKNVKEDGFDLSEVKYISPEEHNKLIKRCKPEKGDIIYTKVGTIGVAQVNTLNFEFSIFVSLALLKLKKDLVLPKYIEYILNSPSVRNQAYSRTQGAANQNLVIRDIKPIKIPLPPIPEQKKIVDYLDNLRENTEKLRKLQEEQLEELEELKKSILDKAFKGELL